MDKNVPCFADKIRKACISLGSGGSVLGTDEIFERAMIQTYADKKRAWSSLRDMVRAGEVERVDRGKYRYLGKKSTAPKKQTVMWRFLRMRRVVTVDDLVVASASSAEYVREWLRGLARKDIVKKREDGAYVLTTDVAAAEPPRDEDKAEKLRELRRRQKQSLLSAVIGIHESACSLCGYMEELVDVVKSIDVA